MKRVLSSIHSGLCIAILIAVIAQFFFAGLGVFGATSFQLHMVTGELIWYASVLLVLLALVGGMGRKTIGFSALLFVLMLIQSVIVNIHQPFIAALHPVNGLAIMGVTANLVRLGSKRVKG
jgi:Family of unknown function (DUF6220)